MGRAESSAPTKQNKHRVKWDVVPQGHLFRCAPLQDAVPYGRGDVGIVPYRTAPGCPLQAQVAGHAGHGAAADADGHGAVLFIQDAAYL